jgi:hypothetical protein
MTMHCWPAGAIYPHRLDRFAGNNDPAGMFL